MERNYRDVGRSSYGDYDDYRSYGRHSGSSYLDQEVSPRDSYLSNPGSSYRSGRSSYGGGSGYDRDIMESLMQQRALQQQLSLRESQLALANSLLQQHQQQHFLSKRRMDPRGGDLRQDFKRPRMMDNRTRAGPNRSGGFQPRDRSTGGRDSLAGGRGTQPGPRYRRSLRTSRGRGRLSTDSGKTPETSTRKSQKTRRGGKPESSKKLKETEVGRDGKNSSGRSACRRDSVKPGTVSKNSTGGIEPMDCDASHSRRNTNPSRDGDKPRGSRDNHDSEKPSGDESEGENKFRCKPCDVVCKDEEELKQHMSSSEHKDCVAGAAEDDGKNSGERKKGHCHICDVSLTGSFLHHQRLTFHKKRRIQVTKGCGWCSVTSFKNFTEVLAHRATEKHIKNQKLHDKRDPRRNDSRHDSRGEGQKKREPIRVDLPPELKKFDPKVVVGQSCVISVTGWFCKLCNKFYNNESAAMETHCMTEPHFNNYKKFMYTKLKAKAEAERDAKEKAEEEQRKKEEEAAEKEEGNTQESSLVPQGGDEEMAEGEQEGGEENGVAEEEEAGEEEEGGGVEGEKGGLEEETEMEMEEGGAEEEEGGDEILAEPEEEYVDDEAAASAEEMLCEEAPEDSEDQAGAESVEGASQEEEPQVTEEPAVKAEPEEEEEEEEEDETEEADKKKATRSAVSSPARGRGRGGSRARRGRRVAK